MRSSFFMLVIVLGACSSKQFAHRDTVRSSAVTQTTHTLTYEPEYLQVNSSLLMVTMPIKIHEKLRPSSNVQPSQQMPNQLALITVPSDTTKRKYRFDLEKDEPEKSSEDFDKKQKQYKGLAVGGFVLSLIPMMYGIPGLLMCIWGLKSERFYGFAVAGLVILAIYAIALLSIYTGLV